MATTDLVRAQSKRSCETTKRLAAELGRSDPQDRAGYAEWSLCEAIREAAAAIGPAETARITGAELARVIGGRQ